jgi:hypothetical protein
VRFPGAPLTEQRHADRTRLAMFGGLVETLQNHAKSCFVQTGNVIWRMPPHIVRGGRPIETKR